MIPILFVGAGLLLGASMGPWNGYYTFSAGVLLLGTAIFARSRKGAPAATIHEEPVKYQTRFFRSGELQQESSPTQDNTGAIVRRSELEAMEEQLDDALLDLLAILKEGLGGVHTAGLFLPARKGGFYLRVWMTDAASILPGASIEPGQGLIGQVVKPEGKRILEGDIVTDSRRLHYYSDNEGVKSVAAVPITVKGLCRGVVLVDSLKENAYDGAVIEKLETCARIAGGLLYYAYLSFEQNYRNNQLMALNDYQRKFLENMSEENILIHVRDYMEKTLEGNRFTIVSRNPENPHTANVVSCSGNGSEGFQNFEFELAEKGLLSLVFEKEQVLNRVFPSESPYIARMSPREPAGEEFHSLLAVPVQTDEGVQTALMVESTRARDYSEHQMRLLLTIARAAGFALSRARLYQEKARLASHDGLTGLQNHRAFQEQFDSELMRAQRYNYNLAVLMVDIDFFKKVNDEYGHPVGDKVLKEVALLLSQAVRAGSDLVARYGGEEFIIALIESDRNSSWETAERIRESVAAKSFEAGPGRNFSVTLSIGAALYPEDSRKGADLLIKADKALYGAKESGRNRTLFYN